MDLTAATYLGDNTVAMCDALLKHLRQETGINIDIDAYAGRSSTDARDHASRVDLIWICGYLGSRLISKGALPVDVIAAPIFEGEREPVYRSVIVARRGWAKDLAQAMDGCLAVNEPESWSGHLALRNHVAQQAPLKWFKKQFETGSHAASVRAVVNNQCDVAGIDSSIWSHMLQTQPEDCAQLEVLDQTQDWPAPPLVVSRRTKQTHRSAITNAILAISPSTIAALEGFSPANLERYSQMHSAL